MSFLGLWGTTTESKEKKSSDSRLVTRLLVSNEDIKDPSIKNFVEELKRFRKNSLRSVAEAEILDNGVWQKNTKREEKPNPFQIELAYHRNRILNLEKIVSGTKTHNALEQRVEDLENQVKNLTALVNKLKQEMSVANFHNRARYPSE